MTKTCTHCKQSKPATLEFFKPGAYRALYNSWCIECHRANARAQAARERGGGWEGFYRRLNEKALERRKAK